MNQQLNFTDKSPTYGNHHGSGGLHDTSVGDRGAASMGYTYGSGASLGNTQRKSIMNSAVNMNSSRLTSGGSSSNNNNVLSERVSRISDKINEIHVRNILEYNVNDVCLD